MAQVCGAVLAAGLGTRMGRPKADLVVDCVRLLDRAAGVLAAAGCSPVVAVLAPGAQAPPDPAVRVVPNPDPGRGMRSSLELAVAAAGPAAALAVLLVDTPGIGPAAVRATVAAWRPGRVAVGAYGGRQGHPVVMAPDRWRQALALAGPDEGARGLLRNRPDLVDLVEVAGDPADLDTPDDVRAWTHRRGSDG